MFRFVVDAVVCLPDTSLPRTEEFVLSTPEKVGYWQLTAQAPLETFLWQCYFFFFSLPNRYWSQEEQINFLHANLCLRVCLLWKPISNDVNNNKVIKSVFQGIPQGILCRIFLSFLIFFTETGTTKSKVLKLSCSPTRLAAKLTAVRPGHREWMEEQQVCMCEQQWVNTL